MTVTLTITLPARPGVPTRDDQRLRRLIEAATNFGGTVKVQEKEK